MKNKSKNKAKGHKWVKRIFCVLVIAAVLCVALFFGLMNHTQIIVGAIQNMAQSTVNTKNLFKPLNPPLSAEKANGQYIVTEIEYSEKYPNSFLDITYPDGDTEKKRPTLIYFHGGGFFGGSKTNGDPLAQGDAGALLDDICAEGFNLVNIDYALVPEYLFPTPLIQANDAFAFLMKHSDEYHLDMENIVIMGSSAGAIITSQLGSIITNPEYAELLHIQPALQPEQVKALVIDDAPLDYDKFSLGTKVLVGNYIKGSIFLNSEEKTKYNNISWTDKHYIPSVLLGSEYHVDMRELHEALDKAGVENVLIDPLLERGIEMPHCFVSNERNDDIAHDAFTRMIAFIKEKTS